MASALVYTRAVTSVVTVTLRTVPLQAPLSMGFPRQKHWSGLPFPPLGIFPTQGSKLGFLRCRQTLHRMSHQESSLE